MVFFYQRVRALMSDGLGRPLSRVQHGLYTVKPGSVWVVSGHTTSFDSRYFGPLPCANILGTAKSVWIGEVEQ